MATAPIFANTPKVGAATISTANTNRDGTGTIGTVFTAGSGGSRIDRITIQALGTTTAGMVRLFIYDGSNYHLYLEILVAAITPSGTVKAFYQLLENVELLLPNSYSLRASTHNAESFKVLAEGADY